MSAVLHHALLALAILALGQAALRAASLVAPAGIERMIVVAVLGVSTAVAETLALGLIGLGSNTLALCLAAALTCAAGLAWLPPPEIDPASEAALWWRRLGPGARVGAAALLGVFAAWVVWQLHYPSIGFDSSIYHYAEVAGWIHNGRPGSILALSYDLPYGNYPVTDEVALTWAAGISRSFVALSLWSPVMLLLLGSAGWLTARNLGVPRFAAALVAAALVTLPDVVHQLNEPQTDLPAMAWLASTAALCTGARRRPELLAPAVVCAGLTVGTKTTPAVVVVAALAVGMYLARGSVRALAGRLALALAAAFAVGGIWYARNLVTHGSPLWPFSTFPWGDPTPQFLRLVRSTLLAHPRATLNPQLDGYASHLAGGVVLLGGALLVLVRGALGGDLDRSLRRGLLVAGAVTAVAFLAFASAPGTGPQRPGFWFGPFSTLRYILPTVGAGTVALALATRALGLTRAVAGALLAAAVILNIVHDGYMGYPIVPPGGTLLVGGAAGVLLLGAASAAWRAAEGHGRRLPSVPRVALLSGAAVLIGALAALASDGYVERHARVPGSTALGNDVVAWFASQPGFAGGHEPIAFLSRAVDAPLAGDHFTHPLKLIPAHASCAEVLAVANRETVVVTPAGFLHNFIGVLPYDSDRCLAGRRPSYRNGAFSVYRPTALH